MEKQYNLCFHVLKRFQDAEILKDLILIGSWCLYFYTFSGEKGYMKLLHPELIVEFLVPHYLSLA